MSCVTALPTPRLDPAEFGRTYTEGDLLPSEERESEIQAKAEAYDILMGVSE